MLNTIFAALSGGSVLLFFVWKKLKDDYLPDQIFATASFVVLGILIAAFITTRFLPTWWFWICLIFAFAGLMIGIFKYKFKFYEVFESFFVGGLTWISLIFLLDSVKTSNYFSFGAFVFIVLLLAAYYFLDTHYKDFSWYASGRVGFSGLLIAGVFFLARAVVAINSFPMVSLAGGRIESILSATLSFALFLATFNLARQKS